MNEELLRGCFEGLRKDAAAGIDRMTKEDTPRIWTPICQVGRAAAPDGVYSAAGPAKYIPKPGSTKQRPLGIPVLKTSWFRRDLSRYWSQSMSRIS